MADWINGTERHRRWVYFFCTQSPLMVSVVVLVAVILVFDIPLGNAAGFASGVALLALTTVLALIVRWHSFPRGVQALLPALDIVGVGILDVAGYGHLHSISLLMVFPAIWLGAEFGVVGVLGAIASAYAVVLVPPLLTPGERGPAEWAEVMIAVLVIQILAVVALIIARVLRASRLAREAAVAESVRIGTVMRTFGDEVDLGLLFLDERGRTVLHNEAMLGFARLARHDAAVGVASRAFAGDQVTPLPPEDQPLARIARGETLVDFQFWVGPRGAQRALLANGRTMTRPDGHVAGSMLIVQDITELLRAGRAREDALATLAHELRTPLTSIVGYTDLLQSEELSETASARLEVIGRNAEHLLRLVSTFLDGLHREVEVQHERIRLRGLVDDAVAVLRTTPGFAERQLHVEVDEGLRVYADRQGLGAVLKNLLSNAVKFSQPCDRIEITAGEDESWVSFVVKNTGSRIDTEDLERIFDRFYRGGNAQRAAIAGTGIGLWVSRQIVSAHGGTLTAEEVDDGASFTVCLPRH